MSLYLLPVELLLSILPHLQYASDLNALSQTCCLFHTVFNPQLYSRFASSCNPNILRLVKTSNLYALGKLLSGGYEFFDTLKIYDSWKPFASDLIMTRLESKSSMLIAAENDDVPILEMLLGALPSIITDNALSGCRLLTHAAKHGRLNAVKFLIAQGAMTEPDGGFGANISALVSASGAGQLPMVKYLIEEVKCNVEIVCHPGQTPLRAAIAKGHLGVVKYLIEEARCNVELGKSPEWTPLAEATIAGHLEVVKYLVERGADPTCGPDWSYQTAFELAVIYGYEDMVLLFLDTFHCEYLDTASIKLFNLMLEPRAHDELGEPWLPRWKKTDIFKTILNRVDLDANLANTNFLQRANLLSVAAETGNASLAQRLLDMGCKNQLAELEHTPVSLAVNNGHVKIIELFLRCPGFRVSELDNMSAAKSGDSYLVRKLLRKVDREDYKTFAEVALHAACYPNPFIPAIDNVFRAFSRLEVEILISMADVLLSRTSLLEYAAAVCTVDQFKAALEQWDLQLDPEDIECKYALVVAALYKNAGVLQFFLDEGFDASSSYSYGSGSSHLLHLVTRLIRNLDYVPIDMVQDENYKYQEVPDTNPPREEPYLDHARPCASIRLLVDRGAPINGISRGQTPLVVATRRRMLNLTKQLLRLGADPLFRVENKPSALELAISEGETIIVKPFLEAIQDHCLSFDGFLDLIPEALPEEKLPKGYSIFALDEETGSHLPVSRSGNFLPIRSAIDEEFSWTQFFITKAMTQHYWRMRYPVPV